MDAIERLWERGINVSGNVIVGSKGESLDTIRETERFVQDINKYPNLTQLHCSVLLPFPGAPLASEFIGAAPEFLHQDVWDMDKAQSIWQHHFCKASPEEIEGWARVINDRNPSARKRYFGLRKEKPI
ncbi:MAG TPA: hypothetical protein VJC16_03025 [Candidatus Nanoarchaeia archaeon]|nr:hypothetical protein [Candidatus Nanoarchaeia archaeon]